MKALKTAASFLIASTIIFQGIGLQAINVLADDSDTLSIAGGYAKQEDKNTTYFTLDTTNNSVTYYNYSGAFEVEDQDFMSVTCTTTEKDPDIVAQKYTGNGYVDINLSECLFTFTDVRRTDGLVYATVSGVTEKGETVYITPTYSSYPNGDQIITYLCWPRSLCSSEPSTCTIAYNSTGGFGIRNENTFLYYGSSFERIEYNEDAEDPYDGHSKEGLVFDLYSYSIVDGLPVYTKATSLGDITEGSQFIIAAERDGKVYAFYPHAYVDEDNCSWYIANVTDTYTTGSTKLDFQVIDDENLVGNEKTTFTIGGTVYPFELQVKKYNTNMLSNVADIELLKGESKTIIFPGLKSLDAKSSEPIVGLNEESFSAIDSYIANKDEKGNGGFINVADCLYKFELQANGNYVISSATNDGLYLTADTCRSNKTTSTEFSIQHVDGSRKFVLIDATDSSKSFYLGSDAIYNGNSADSVNEVYLYQKSSGNGSLEVPGYDRVTSITPNGEYLIVLISRSPSEAKYYVVNPSIEESPKASYVERTSDCYIKLDITAEEAGVTTITGGTYSFKVVVKDEGEIVTYENTPFQEFSNSFMGSSYLPISKIHVSEGAMNIGVGYVGYYDTVKWNSLYGNLTFNFQGATTDSVVGLPFVQFNVSADCASDGVVQDYLCCEYTYGTESSVKLIPVWIYPSDMGDSSTTSEKLYYHTVAEDKNVKAYYSINGLKNTNGEYLTEAQPGETFCLTNNDGNFAFNMFYAPVSEDCTITDFDVYSSSSPEPTDLLMLDAATAKETSFYKSEIGQVQATNYGVTFDAVLNEALKKGCTAGYAYNKPTGEKLTFVAKATEAEIVPLTDLSVSLSKDIKLSDGTTATAGKKVNLYKIYYVNSSESTLAAFSGTKSISSVKAVYDLSTGSDVTSSFVKSGNDMLFTSAGAGQKDYVVEYAFEDGTSKLYAVRVITLEDMFVGTSLSIGGKISLNFYATYATQTTASNSAYDTYPVAGVDYSNLPSDIQPTVRFKVGDKVVSEGVVSTKTVGSVSGAKYYGFTFEGIYAYDIGKMITAELIYDNKVIASCEYSVGDYMEAVFNSSSDTKLNDMLAALAAYGCSAEKYALDKGWVDVLTLENKHYDHLIPDSISTTNAIVDNGTGIADFYGASVVLSEGATVSLKFSFTVDTDDISSVNLIIDNASCITADGKSTVTVNGADFTYAGTKDGKKLYTVSIDNIAPYNWNNSFTVYLDKDGASKGLTYSVDNYFVDTQKDKTVGELVKLMFAYGEAARVWAGK